MIAQISYITDTSTLKSFCDWYRTTGIQVDPDIEMPVGRNEEILRPPQLDSNESDVHSENSVTESMTQRGYQLIGQGKPGPLPVSHGTALVTAAPLLTFNLFT